MAFRAKEAAIAVGLVVAMAAAQAAEVRVDVRHDHWRGRGVGSLVASEKGLSFQETGGKAEHQWTLAWDDIQQLWISPTELRVLTYADRPWRLGADREYRLEAQGESTFGPLYSELKDRLDQRLVAALGDAPAEVLWSAPAKLRQRFGGPEGVLRVAADRIVFDSAEKGEARTWRVSDIENVSSSGPFDLSITTFERARGAYADRRVFTFQLKQRMPNGEYDALWRRLNRWKQLDYVRAIQEKQQ
ncbi:MAG TPA: hypothetical protein VER03_24865 [Bryobacteraceae bacterium]|nr:hypothetical protein [Bryobacteraceae bacterium]